MLRILLCFSLGLMGVTAPARSQALVSVTGPYICPPCGGECDAREFTEPGNCPHCGMTLIRKDQMKKVAIFLYDGVEILDFSGPGEVFAAARGTGDVQRFQVFTVAATRDPILSQGFARVTPEYSVDDCPRPDIIVLPGGGTGPSIANARVMDWIKANTSDDQIALSVCTGAFLLQAAGRLDGKKATTWHGAIDRFRQRATKTEVLENVRWVDNGNIITTAGVSAGIDGALHLVERLMGAEAAQGTARYMEYDKWNPEDGVVVPQKKPVVKYLNLAWSRDGKKLAFSAIKVGEDWSGYSADRIRLCVMDVESGRIDQVADGAMNPDFAPDGCRLAYQKTVAENSDIYVLDLCTGKTTRLTDHSAKDAAPSWSPDGRRIAFNSNRSGTVEVFVMDADGSNPVQLTRSGEHKSYNPVWSPKGDALVYYFEKGDNRDQIYLTDARGSYHRNVTRDTLHNFYPSWTPEGEILFTTGEQMYLINPDGTGRRPLEGVSSFFGRLSPAGKRVAYIGKDGVIYLQPRKGGEAQALVNPEKLSALLE